MYNFVNKSPHSFVNYFLIGFFLLTVTSEIHAPKLQGANNLSLHVPLRVDEDGGQVSIRVVGYASGGDALEEFGGWKLGSQLRDVLVDQ